MNATEDLIRLCPEREDDPNFATFQLWEHTDKTCSDCGAHAQYIVIEKSLDRFDCNCLPHKDNGKPYWFWCGICEVG